MAGSFLNPDCPQKRSNLLIALHHSIGEIENFFVFPLFFFLFSTLARVHS